MIKYYLKKSKIINSNDCRINIGLTILQNNLYLPLKKTKIMAQVENVTLTLTPTSSSVSVRVDYSFLFSNEELGRNFKILIELLAIDTAPIDTHPIIPFPGYEDILYRMKFPVRIGPISYSNFYRSINVDSMRQNGSVTNVIGRELLDEDPGMDAFNFRDPRTGRVRKISIARRDELLARVTLIQTGEMIGESTPQYL